MSLNRTILMKMSSTKTVKLSMISICLMLALSACSSERDDSETEGIKSPDNQPMNTASEAQTQLAAINQSDSSSKAHANNDAMVDFSQLEPEVASADAYVAGKQASERMVKMKSLNHEQFMGQMSVSPKDRFIEPMSRDDFQKNTANGIMVTGEIPVSTFSIDTDTGSYATLRRWINQGRLPQQGTVRVEEMINYFDYHYPAPSMNEAPFSVHTELAPSPYNANKVLLKIGLKGYELTKSQLGASNLVFLLDVSGSMSANDKLPLLKTSLKLLSQQLTEQDNISILVYAGATGVVLDGCKGNDIDAISQALDNLKAGGSTNGGAGIQKAYQLAQKHFIPSGVNRVILATDGDFNVGMTDHQALMDLIEAKRDKGIALTTLGFGQGNYNDHLMEQLADKGNGQYAYIDNLNEARKVLVDELSSTLMTIAKDVKIQMEFNPALVSEYRLIGYENRVLNREDFNNDKVDAGEIGAGHTVTALYELSYVDSPNQANDALRYGMDKQTGQEKYSRDEIAFLKLRYKPVDEVTSQLLSYPIRLDSSVKTLAQTSDDFRFSAAVAGLGQLLNNSHYIHDLNYSGVINLAQSALGKDEFGYRHEFIQLAKNSELLSTQEPVVSQQAPIKARRLVSPVVEMRVTPLPKSGHLPRPLPEIHVEHPQSGHLPYSQSKTNIDLPSSAHYIAPHIKEKQLEIDKGVQGVQTFQQ